MLPLLELKTELPQEAKNVIAVNKIMDNLQDRITLDPEVCNGKPTIRGRRITVKTILEYLAAGETVENILDAYPVLEKRDVLAAIQYAVKMFDHEIIAKSV